jgi:hypothetical protein
MVAKYGEIEDGANYSCVGGWKSGGPQKNWSFIP